MDCALEIRVPSRENRDVYTEQDYLNGHVLIVQRPEAAAQALPYHLLILQSTGPCGSSDPHVIHCHICRLILLLKEPINPLALGK